MIYIHEREELSNAKQLTSSPEVAEILEQLHAMNHAFHLGGSRQKQIQQWKGMTLSEMFRNPKGIVVDDNADIDLYCGGHNVDLLFDSLKSIGFRQVIDIDEDHGYLDSEALAIFTIDIHSGSSIAEAIAAVPIEIVVRRDVEFYKAVWESITPEFFYDYLWKSSPAGVAADRRRPIIDQLLATARQFYNR